MGKHIIIVECTWLMLLIPCKSGRKSEGECNARPRPSLAHRDKVLNTNNFLKLCRFFYSKKKTGLISYMAAANSHVYKVALCGKSDVGKTSIFRRIKGDGFRENTGEFGHLGEWKINVDVNGSNVQVRPFY